ncbi:thermonuclease family protein [Microbulbifer variabilis]|uniref:thermonuclease family protein n=1 Tax=Microbulbifer variabilis TaxID=266805 RepID=UPI001CFE31AE|nr:thermonuclease family protein [Microbulbifer variabilis]
MKRLLLLCAFSTTLQAAPLTNYRIIDGDTVHGYIGSEYTEIRLQCIDAPETYPSTQSYGPESTQTLISLLSYGPVDFQSTGRDQYGRETGYLFVNGYNINQEMVARGAAWNYAYYCGNKFELEQDIAYYSNLGLWEDSNAIDPYCFRKNMDRDFCYYNPENNFILDD